MVSYAPWQLAFHVHPDDRILYTEFRPQDRQLRAERAKAEIRRHGPDLPGTKASHIELSPLAELVADLPELTSGET